MRKYNKYLILFAILCFYGTKIYSAPTEIFEGPGSTGGRGNICKVNNRWQLLEFIQFGTPQGQHFQKAQLAQLTLFQRFGMGREFHAEKKLKDQALAVIEKHRQSSPAVSNLLTHAIESLEFYWTRSNFDQVLGADFSRIASICNQSNTVMSMVTNKNLTLVSIDSFNKLDGLNQVALVIHEALRQIQYRYEGNGSDKDLQRLTYQLIAVNALNLENHPFFAEPLSHSRNNNKYINDSIFYICSISKSEVSALYEFLPLVEKNFAIIEKACRENRYNDLLNPKLRKNIQKSILQFMGIRQKTRAMSLAGSTLYLIKLSIENFGLSSITKEMLTSRFDLIDATYGLHNIRYREYLEYTLNYQLDSSQPSL